MRHCTATATLTPSATLARALGAAWLALQTGLAQAHPGHGAPDIIHGIDAAASASTAPAAFGGSGTALLFGLAGVALLMAGPVAARAGRHLPAPVLRLVRPLGALALAAAAAIAVGLA